MQSGGASRGNTADVLALHDALTGALIGLARAADGIASPGASAWEATLAGLFAMAAMPEDAAALHARIEQVHGEKARLTPQCSACAMPCGRHSDYDMEKLRSAGEDVRAHKALILCAIMGLAAYAYPALRRGHADDALNRFLFKALFALGEEWEGEDFLPIALEAGGYAARARALFCRA